MKIIYCVTVLEPYEDSVINLRYFFEKTDAENYLQNEIRTSDNTDWNPGDFEYDDQGSKWAVPPPYQCPEIIEIEVY